MQFDPDELPPPIRPRPTRPRLVNINEERLAERHAAMSSAPGSDVSMETTVILHPLPDEDDDPTQPRMASVRFKPLPVTGEINDINDGDDIDDISEQSTRHLKQLSGMMPAIKLPPQGNNGATASPAPDIDEQEEGYWPHGIQQTGALPVVNLYGRRPFGQTLPQTPAIVLPASPKRRSAWRVALSSPAAKIVIGLIIGVGLLFLVAHFVDLPTTIAILHQNLATPRGIALALLSGVAFLLAFSIRGVRWKLFLNPVGKVSTLKAIQLFLVGIFLNFLLPIRGGEVAKCLMLKRTSNIPVSKSLPTVAMDKALDLMPALFIMAIVPFLGIKMDIKLWVVLALVGSLLVCLIAFIALAAWKRNAAIHLLQRMTGLLPQSIGDKIAGFATGFVDSLLAGASQPRIFVPAMLLTLVAVTFDGLFAMLAFWTIGYQISFGTAIFGYTVYNMFYILPTPPGQVGSNEAVGLLVFAGLLHLPANKVTAMFVFSHPWSALLMTVTAMICLSALGLKLSSAMKVQTEGENAPDL
ncbi:MAG: lysylphosphatidylglycerol synthase transmembrane domain-containing protein [Ktedonobacteraceae bacterium]